MSKKQYCQLKMVIFTDRFQMFETRNWWWLTAELISSVSIQVHTSLGDTDKSGDFAQGAFKTCLKDQT